MGRRRIYQVTGATVVVALFAAGLLLLDDGAVHSADVSSTAPAMAPASMATLPAAGDEPESPALLVDAATATEAGRAAPPTADQPTGAIPHVLTGRVLEPAGGPLPGARILVVPDAATLAAAGLPRRGNHRLAMLTPEQLSSAQSGADGRFEITENLLPRRAGTPRGDERPERPLLLVVHDSFALLGHECRDRRSDRYDAGDLVLLPGAAVEGRVVDPLGHPIGGARVAASIEPGWHQGSRPPDAVEGWWYVTTTDVTGRYALANLPGLPVSVGASMPGRVPKSMGVEAPAGTVTSVPDLVLEPGSAVAGMVVDPTGQPVRGAAVAAVSVDLVLRGWPVEMRALYGALLDTETRTPCDDAGRFVIEGLTGRNVSLTALAEGWEPGVTHDIAPGRRDVVIALRPRAELLVHVRDRATGTPVDVTLEARLALAKGSDAVSWHDPLPVAAVPDRPGEFVVRGAGAEATRIEALAPGFARTIAWAEGLPPGARGELLVELARGCTLAGRVIDEVGEPVADAGLLLRPGAPQRDQRVVEAGRTDREGGFAFAGLPAATFDLVVEADGFARSTRTDLVVGEVPGDPLTVTLVRAGDIEGRLLDHEGQAARGFQVAAHRAGETSAITGTDTGGRFALRDLLPGTWNLSSVTIDELPVEVRAGESAHVELRIAPPSFLEGSVMCGGSPVAGASVTLASAGMPWVGTRTGKDGRFKVQVAVGTWSIEVRTDAGGLASAQANILRGETRRIDFVLPGGVLVVHAVDPDGHPVAGASLRFERRSDRPVQAGGDPNEAWDRLAKRDTGPDGVARFEQLASGLYRVRGSSGDWLIEPVEARLGEDTVEITAVARPAARIAGRVASSLGVPLKKGSWVYLFGSDGGFAGADAVDAEGRFDLDGLEAGRYTVAVYSIPPERYGEADSLAERTVTLESGQRVEVTLEMQPAP